MTTNKVRCPVCKGEGRIAEPKTKYDEIAAKAKAAVLLREAGFSIREIMRLLDYKSPLSIQMHLKNEKMS